MKQNKVDIEQVSKAISDYMKKKGKTEEDFMGEFCTKRHYCSLEWAKGFFELKGFGNYFYLCYNHDIYYADS